MSTSERDRQNTLKKNFSSYKGNSKKGKQYTVGENSSSGSSSSSSSSSSTNKATIRETTEEERKANMLITSTQERANGIDRTKEALEKIKESSSSRELSAAEKQSVLDRYDQSPLRPDKIKDEISRGSRLQPSIQQERSSGDISREILQSQTQQSTTYDPFQKSSEQQLRDAEHKEQKEAMDLGRFEGTAAGYESHVSENLSPLTGSKYAAGRFIGGALEAVVYTPVAVPRLIAGLVRNPVATTQAVFHGTAEQIIHDPARGAGQLVGMAITGKALGEGAAAIKQKLPAIGTGEQSFLVKTKIPDTVKSVTEQPKPAIQAELKGSAFGQDVFKISEIQDRMGAAAKPQPSMEVLVGENKGGYTDVYFKADKATAQQLSQKYTGNIENIKTPQGSAVVFEPKGKRAAAVFEKTDAPRVGTPERILLGEEIQPGIKTSNPFRIEQRRNLQPGSLELTESAKALPEATRTVNAKGKAVTDFDIYDYYKTPEAADPLQLNSGTKIIEQQRPGFFASEEATLGPRKTVIEYREPTIIGDMPEMQTRYVRAKQELIFKDPATAKSDLSHLQKLYDEAAKRGHDPVRGPDPFSDQSLKISRTSSPRGSSRLLPIPSTFVHPAPSAELSTSFETDHLPGLSQNAAPMIDPFTDTSVSPRPSSRSQFDVMPAAGTIAPSAGFSSPIIEPTISVIEEPPMRSKGKKEEFNDPFPDFGRFGKEWENPVLTGFDIIGSPRRRK